MIGRDWSSAKLFKMQNHTDSANRDVPLTVENVIFLISWVQSEYKFFLEEKQNWSVVFFIKKILLYYGDNINQLC